MRNRDDYRSMHDGTLLLHAREDGIDPEMAIVLAERLEAAIGYRYASMNHPCGGRYTFNNRSE